MSAEHEADHARSVTGSVRAITSEAVVPMIRLDAVGKTVPGRAGRGRASSRSTSRDGEICVLVGPSGCGKTTTLKMINRLDRADVGTDLPRRRRRHPRRPGRAAPPHGLRDPAGRAVPAPDDRHEHRHRPDAARLDEGAHRGARRRAARARRARPPDVYRGRYPAQLSGGQRQRVGVARALAADPARPPDGRAVRRHRPGDPRAAAGRVPPPPAARCSKTVVFVTHDIEEAVKMGDRIAILNVGGVLEQYDTPARDPRAPGVRHGRRLRRRRPRAEAVAGHPIDPELPRAPADGAPARRDARRRARGDRAVRTRRWVAVVDDERRAVRLRRRGDVPTGDGPVSSRDGAGGGDLGAARAGSCRTRWRRCCSPTWGGWRCSTATASSACSPPSRCIESLRRSMDISDAEHRNRVPTTSACKRRARDGDGSRRTRCSTWWATRRWCGSVASARELAVRPPRQGRDVQPRRQREGPARRRHDRRRRARRPAAAGRHDRRADVGQHRRRPRHRRRAARLPAASS